MIVIPAFRLYIYQRRVKKAMLDTNTQVIIKPKPAEGYKNLNNYGMIKSYKEGLEMFSFQMLQGSWKSLDDPASIVLSESTEQTLFGDHDPINQMLRIDNHMDVKVTGVFKEVPSNSRFHSLQFISSWDLLESERQM